MTDRINYLKEKVRSYYSKHPPTPPPEFYKREFGAGDNKKIDYRHLSFNNEKDFENFFVEKAPLYASYSTAYYEFPDGRPMPKKNIQGADLVFEFDAECDHNKLCCETCMNWARDQTFRLIDEFLTKDFGFSKKDIIVSFSGSRGYHIHIRNKEIHSLSKRARVEMIDYLQLNNIDFARLLQNATLQSKGWKGRFATNIYNFIEGADVEKLKKYKFQQRTIDKILERKNEILAGIEKGNFDQLKNADKFWKKISSESALKVSADLDQSVTVDISRLIRLPTTIHSTTGFLDMYVKDLERFNPFKDAIVYSNYPEKIKFLKDAPEFCMNEMTFGPYKTGAVEEVPEYVACFCVGKDVAEPIK